jgi:hypothetical protein
MLDSAPVPYAGPVGLGTSVNDDAVEPCRLNE